MNIESLDQKITKTFRTNDAQKRALTRLNLETLRDLLYFFPLRYGHLSSIREIAELQDGEYVTVFGSLRSIEIKKTFRNNIPSAQGILEDLHGNRIKLLWLHQVFIAKKLKQGQRLKLTGKVHIKNNTKTLMNPEFETLNDIPIDRHESLFQRKGAPTEDIGFPIYRESRGITSKWLYHNILKLLASGVLEKLEDPLPEYIRNKYKLPSLSTSLFWIHNPRNKNDAESARKRFAFEEIFYIQIENGRRRARHRKMQSYILDRSKELEQKFIDRFPFTPTNAQSKALDAILSDMESEQPMTRLLEGDVGSGKTFVAAVTAHCVVQNKPRKKSGESYNFGRLQVAYMAPTEVLATQLFENFVQYFENTGVQIGLLTGTGCKKFPSKVNPKETTNISRTQLLKWIKNGEIPIVIGTHALIQKKVEFQDLALVIIDEQHRFGTKQRMELTKKDHRIPHYLSMSATPIPRTLALTLYGDLDLSVIDTMPSGRKPVITEIVSPNEGAREKTYHDIRTKLHEGRQAYVICPRIDEPDPNKKSALQLKSVKTEAERLQKNIFPEFRIAIMHSKMKKAEKEVVMEKFYNHEIDILVSTSVVEVGVNVPNATSIIIEGAERFGLAQLHQLRGRVIRSNHQAYCYLFADAKTDKTMDRMCAIVEAKNGFELAEIDLSLRGVGDLAGIKQWGMSDLAMEAIKNIKMVEFARTEANTITTNDPELENFPEIAEKVKDEKYNVHFE